MRLLRALSAALVLTLSLVFVADGQATARAADVDGAENEADRARRRAAQADSLLSAAASRRAGIEAELAASFVRLGELNSQLSRVSVRLDDLRQAVERAETTLAGLSDDIAIQAVDAYVRAVTVSAASVVGTSSAESAIVAATNLEAAIGSDKAAMADLTIKRDQLEELEQQFAAEREEVAAIQAEVDAETAKLESLLAEADQELADRAAEAIAADAAYRAALDAVDLARARQEERERQEQRPSAPAGTGDEGEASTTAGEGPAATVTAPPTTEAPPATTAPPPSTTTPVPAPLVGGAFPPTVERWRSVVASHFPASRVDAALAVIQCESNGDPNAYNPYSGASGLFQFLPATWATVSESAGFAGASVFDGAANIGTAAWLSSYYEGRGSDPWTPWTCRP
ncbi:MAG TPA: transglycosylase SLT domain-containing protein [Acidimicrobiia bacterium]|nr:transglycosylase SLT domain-containing protein [Acidimicrobiia bacterium]